MFCIYCDYETEDGQEVCAECVEEMKEKEAMDDYWQQQADEYYKGESYD